MACLFPVIAEDVVKSGARKRKVSLLTRKQSCAMDSPEERARANIDRLLTAAGWVVQDRSELTWARPSASPSASSP